MYVMIPNFTIGPALPEERLAAFRRAFGYLPPADRDARAASGERMILSGELDADGLLVARRNGAIVGAVVCLVMPGAAAMIWPPQGLATDPDREPIENALIAHGIAWVRRLGAKLGQMLLLPTEYGLAAPLLRNGFQRVTQLLYMKHLLTPTPPPVPAGAPVTFRAYPTDEERFRQTLMRTYELTQDCPEITGSRTLDEILIGHRSQGKYDPNRWWLALHEDTPVGVMMLNDLGPTEGWDVAYTGVVPEARRRGFGLLILQHALAETARAGAKLLALAVDIRNTPAWALYQRAGFTAYDQREVYLAVWREPG
jgi:ribosomal protein S18 acetylase RimI-like enzyme